MAWRTQSSSNAGLIQGLRNVGIIKSSAVEQCMLRVDRGNYSKDKSQAYNDCPHSIGFGATISAPHMHAECLELLKGFVTKSNAKVLDVGSGSGYLVACFGRMLGDGGSVLGIDVVPELVSWSVDNVKKTDGDLLDKGLVNLQVGDGWKPPNGPYDAIHVGAAAHKIPDSLLEQLANGGRMIIPVGPQDGDQYLMQIDRALNGQLSKKNLLGVRYVPLVSK
eukprot:TRINITY_DN957_c0_g1_i1.p1 TRINITY_DN957_c0_g1~~TRINITY_DN957_c0_g1_i1.p1  ORF type:complete len:243 (+),score=62.32 TRINITY_DN957_c0_g1_i1:69-731(+)